MFSKQIRWLSIFLYQKSAFLLTKYPFVHMYVGRYRKLNEKSKIGIKCVYFWCTKIINCDWLFLAFKYVHSYRFFETKQMIIHICTSEILRKKNGFSVHNIHLYLCGKVEDTKWILCCRKIGVKWAYLRFLMYKMILFLILIWGCQFWFSVYVMLKRRLKINFRVKVYLTVPYYLCQFWDGQKWDFFSFTKKD